MILQSEFLLALAPPTNIQDGLWERCVRAARKRSRNITDQLVWWVTPFYLFVSYRKVMGM